VVPECFDSIELCSQRLTENYQKLKINKKSIADRTATQYAGYWHHYRPSICL